MKTWLPIHVGVLVVALLSAGYLWTRDKTAVEQVRANVTVWAGKPDDVQSIAYHSDTRKTVLVAQKDAVGRWFDGTVSKLPIPEPEPEGEPDPDPNAEQVDEADSAVTQNADTGADVLAADRENRTQEQGAREQGDEQQASEAKPPQDKVIRVVQVVSISAAKRLCDNLAPLKALREIGVVDSAKLEQYGLDKPEATITVTIANKEHTLRVGKAAPGGADRYVKYEPRGVVYAVEGEFVRDLQAGETVLNERDLHQFDPHDLTGVRLESGTKVREELWQRVSGVLGWIDPQSPDKIDEVFTTWMAKIERLMPYEYVAALPKHAPGQLVLKIDYRGRGKSIGFLELYRFPPSTPAVKEAKDEWYIKTERTRKYARVLTSSVEQIQQDMQTVLRDR